MMQIMCQARSQFMHYTYVHITNSLCKVIVSQCKQIQSVRWLKHFFARQKHARSEMINHVETMMYNLAICRDNDNTATIPHAPKAICVLATGTACDRHQVQGLS